MLRGFVLVLLAVFFCSLIVWRVPVTGYVVRTELTLRRPSKAEPLAPVTQVHPASQSNRLVSLPLPIIASAQHQANARLAVSSDAASHLSVAKLRDQLRLRQRKAGDQAPAMLIEFRGADRDWSVAFVESLVEQLKSVPVQTSHHEQLEDSVRQAKWGVDSARHYERKARLDLEQYLVSHFENVDPHQTEDAMRRRQFDGHGSRVADPTADSTRDARAEQLASQRRELRAQFDRLSTELTQLLRTVTPHHPAARDVARQMKDVQARLNELPTSAAAANFADSTIRPTSADISAKSGFAMVGAAARLDRQNEDVGPENLADTKIYAQLLDQLHDAAGCRQAAEDQLLQAIQQLHAVGSESQAGATWADPQPIHVAQLGGRPSGRQIGWIALLATVAASFVTLWLRHAPSEVGGTTSQSWQRRRLVHSETHRYRLDQASSIPPSHFSRIDRQQVARMTVRCSEWFLTVLAVVLLLAVLADSPLVSRFATDPFGTLTETITP
jgi:hypothetical protein